MMDRHLWERVAQFHGPNFLELVQKEQGTLPELGLGRAPDDGRDQQQATVGLVVGGSGRTVADENESSRPKKYELPVTSSSSKALPKKIGRFSENIQSFIAKKADMLFKSEDLICCSSSKSIEDGCHYAVMPPVEQFMKTPSKENHERTFSVIAVNDVMIARVLTLKDFGLFVRLLSFCSDKARWFENINMVALLPVTELCDRYLKSAKVEDFSVGDLVRCQVIKVTAEGKVMVSLKTPESATSESILGLIADSDVPVQYHLSQELDESFESYDTMLQNSTGFDNPYCLNSLIPVLGLQENAFSSLMRGLQKSAYPKSELAEELNSVQSAKWSMEIVAKGVLLFKSGDFMQAVAKFDKALQMCPKNIEALVARGALYANRGSLTKAIEDFESALKVNPHHRNATKYLTETLMEKAKQLESKPDIEEGIVCYRRVLTLNSNHAEAKMCLEKLYRDKERASQTKPAQEPPPDKAPKASSEHALQRFMMEKSTGALKDFLRQELSHKDKINKQKKKMKSERSKRRSRSPKRSRKEKSSKMRKTSSSSSSSSPSPRGRRRSRSRSSSSTSVTSSSSLSSSSERNGSKRKRRKSRAKKRMRKKSKDRGYDSSDDEKRRGSATRSNSRRRSSSIRNSNFAGNSQRRHSRDESNERDRSRNKESRKRSRSSSQRRRHKSSSRKSNHDGSPTLKKHRQSKDKLKKKSKDIAFEWVVKDDEVKETSKKITKPARKSRSRSSSVEFISEIFLGKLKKEDLDKQEVERKKKQILDQRLEEEKKQKELLEKLKEEESKNLSQGNVDDGQKAENLLCCGGMAFPTVGKSHKSSEEIKESDKQSSKTGYSGQQSTSGSQKKGHCNGSNCGTSDEEDGKAGAEKKKYEVKEKMNSDQKILKEIHKTDTSKKIIGMKDMNCRGSNCGTSEEKMTRSVLMSDIRREGKCDLGKKQHHCSGSDCGSSDEENERDDLQRNKMTFGSERSSRGKQGAKIKKERHHCSGSNCGTSDEEKNELSNKTQTSSSSKSFSSSSSSISSTSASSSSSSSPSSSSSSSSVSKQMTSEEEGDDDLDAYRIDDPEALRTQVLDMKKISYKGDEIKKNISTHKNQEDNMPSQENSDINTEYKQMSDYRDSSVEPDKDNYDEAKHKMENQVGGSPHREYSNPRHSSPKNKYKRYDQTGGQSRSQSRSPRTGHTQYQDCSSGKSTYISEQSMTQGHSWRSPDNMYQCHDESAFSGAQSKQFGHYRSNPNRNQHRGIGGQSPRHHQHGSSPCKSDQHHGTGETPHIGRLSERHAQHKPSPDNRYQHHCPGGQSPRHGQHGSSPHKSFQHHGTGEVDYGGWQSTRHAHHRPSPDNRWQGPGGQSPRHGQHGSSPHKSFQHHGTGEVGYGGWQSTRHAHHRPSPDNRWQGPGGQSPRHGQHGSSPHKSFQHHGTGEVGYGGWQSTRHAHHRPSPDNRWQGPGGQSPRHGHHGSSPYKSYQHHGTGEVVYGGKQSTRHGHHRPSPDNRWQYQSPGGQSPRHDQHGSSPQKSHQHHGTDEVVYGGRQSTRHGYHRPSPDRYQYQSSGGQSPRDSYRGSSPYKNYQHHGRPTGEVCYGGRQSTRHGQHRPSPDDRYQYHGRKTSHGRRPSKGQSRSHWSAKDYIERDKQFWQYYRSFNPSPLGEVSEKQVIVEKIYERDFKSASIAAATSRAGLKNPHRNWWLSLSLNRL